MSSHERKVLATIERQLRSEDPEPAAAFGRTPSPSFSTHEFPLSISDVLLLLGALTGLIAVCSVFAGRLDSAEAERSEYGWMLPSTRARARLLKPGTMVLSQPPIPAPTMLTFPYPPWATRPEEVADEDESALFDLPRRRS